MGNRANCVIKQHDNTEVWLYTHWRGAELPELVKTALAKNQRWDDEQYLARIIFDVMTDGCHGEEGGFGISTSMGDNSHDLIVVNPGKQTVTIENEDRKVLRSFTFESYITA